MSVKPKIASNLSKSSLTNRPKIPKSRSRQLSLPHKEEEVNREDSDTNSSAETVQKKNENKSHSNQHKNIKKDNSDHKRYVSTDFKHSSNDNTKKAPKFKKLLFWVKDKDAKKSKQNSKKKTTFICDDFEDLPEIWQKKIKKLHIDTSFNEKRFKILLNVLHFLTKDSFRMSTQEKKPRERRPYASEKVMSIAESSILITDEKLIKKVYKHVEFSGKGGFGRVFSAKEIETKRRVAIKKLPQLTEKSKLNNLSEIGFLLTCKHPNIVTLLKSYHLPEKKEVWIVTEFLEGGTLSEAVKVHQFSEHHIAYIAREILKALKYLHSLGVVHRDLKSGNVMMSIEGRIKLIDFGLCCDVKDGSRLQMLGSPYWIPPEMVKGIPHSCPADIWSFAVCVLEMFLKEPPNAHSRLFALYTSSTKGLKPSIPESASEMSRDFLSKCLRTNPKKRATAEELLEHPFVNQPKIEVGIQDILRGIFVSNSLALSGI